MKKTGLFLLTASLPFALAACGSDESGPSIESQPLSDDDSELEEAAWYDELGYTSFEMEVEYEYGEYDVSYDYNNGDPQAEISDSRGDEEREVEDEEALLELGQVLPDLDVTPQSNELQLMNESVNNFQLDDNYQEMQIDVEFDEAEAIQAEDSTQG
ncbi:YusW-like protein [Sinobaca qinghaiensis]|uniref:YusW-like protein n=1 Tax=Sinobaca qinghaiensis TaxID=342944 RepID=A0A419V9E8_9BACL|nr:YusW family protein [Sinobaca qinghaiensis]RKD76583.1 YusW-like protein [Sinobaca qinghaiensis]